MSATHTITCDGCGKDLTSTDAMPRHRLALRCEALPHSTDTVYAVMVSPPLAREHHFCDTTCLRSWLERVAFLARRAWQRGQGH